MAGEILILDSHGNDGVITSYIELLCDQLDFYANMVSSRNMTWKTFLDEKFSILSLTSSMQKVSDNGLLYKYSFSNYFRGQGSFIQINYYSLC